MVEDLATPKINQRRKPTGNLDYLHQRTQHVLPLKSGAMASSIALIPTPTTVSPVTSASPNPASHRTKRVGINF
jgi:hypothetical protein